MSQIAVNAPTASNVPMTSTQRIWPVFWPALAGVAVIFSPSPPGLISGLFAMQSQRSSFHSAALATVAAWACFIQILR
jgi:hypothetical protein